ncbi:hypothetical protein OQA88_12614 [Cercophora sp. LCS_1]
MPFLTLADNTSLYYKDWGNPTGLPVVFSHGWPLNSDSWEAQMFHLASHNYRVIAHDRRGHGRSSQPWHGNNMDTYADDLLQLFVHLDLRNATLVGHSTGGGEVTRFVAQSPERVSKAVLVGAIPPLLVSTPANLDGVPIANFDALRDGMKADRAALMREIPETTFFGFNRPGAQRREGLVEGWFQQAMMAGFVGVYDCIKAFSETDFTEDLKKIEVPTLILHGDDDQLVPIDNSARKMVKLLKNPTLKVYEGGNHAIHQTHVERVNKDLLEFLEG